MSIQFSDIHGENVSLSNDKLSVWWNQAYSGGYVFSHSCLEIEEQLEIELEGSGHVDFGITKRDPMKIGDLREAVRREELKKVTDVRVHKRACVVTVRQRLDNDFRKIDFEHSGLRVVGKVQKDERVWLYINLKFGSLSAKLNTKEGKFHQICGENINFLDSKKKSVKLKVENPAAVCCLSRELYTQEYVELSFRPIKDGDKTPSKYHVVLGTSEIEAKQLCSRDPESFRVGAKSYQPYRWKFIYKFEKEDCDGKIKIGLNSHGRLSYSHTDGCSTEVPPVAEGRSNNILILFELFRSTVTIEELVQENSYDYAVADESLVSKPIPSVDPEQNEESVYVDLIPDDKTSDTKTESPEIPPDGVFLRRKTDGFKRKKSKSAIVPKTSKIMEETAKRSTLVSVQTIEGENMYWEVQEVEKEPQQDLVDRVVAKTTSNEKKEGISDNPIVENKSEEKTIPKVSSVQNLIQKFSILDEKAKENVPIQKSPLLGRKEDIVQNGAGGEPPTGGSSVEVYTSYGDESNDSAVYDTCEVREQQATVLGDTFQSINMLLNIGKKGKDKDKKEKKKKKGKS